MNQGFLSPKTLIPDTLSPYGFARTQGFFKGALMVLNSGYWGDNKGYLGALVECLINRNPKPEAGWMPRLCLVGG